MRAARVSSLCAWLGLLLWSTGCMASGTGATSGSTKAASARGTGAATAEARAATDTKSAVAPASSGSGTAPPRSSPASPDDPARPFAAAAAPDTPVTAAAPAAFEPRRGERFRVLILGDSMAATDFGKQLEKRLDADERTQCARRGKSSTGLARPDFFDWMSEAKKRVRRHDPDLIVVIIGGNDGQDLLPKVKGSARRIFWKGKRWPSAYRARIEALAGVLMAEGRRLVWLELPAMDHPRLEKKLQLIRAVQKQTVEGLGGDATYLSTRGFFYEGQTLLTSAKVKGYRSRQKLRQDDGIHFSVAGAKYFANRVHPRVLEALGLPPQAK